jgi:hypothetical protein
MPMGFWGRAPFEKGARPRKPTSENFWRFRLPLVAAWHRGVERKIFIVRWALLEHGYWYELRDPLERRFR